MSRLLVVSPDVIGKRMAGVGIRYWNLSAALSRRGIEVTLATLGDDLPTGHGFRVVGYEETSYKSLARFAEDVDLLLVSGYLLSKFPLLKELDIPIVVDLWAPFILENLEVFAGGSLAAQMATHRGTVAVVNDQLQAGDFFICASEKQQDFWLGMLAANNRINPYTYAQDSTFNSLLAVVPFGLPPEPPSHKHRVLKGIHPGIAENDRVILWSGGIWDWYDPITLIRAVEKVHAAREDAKLVFLGVRHPNPAVAQSRQLAAAVQLSKELGLYDRHVFFVDWVPYEEMENYLLEADIGAVLHHRHIETRFSFRARILGYLWAQLPILMTEGSPSSEITRRENLGSIVGYEDVDGTADAILAMLSSPDLRLRHQPHFERVRERFTWEKVVEPLSGFCLAPAFAADKGRMIAPQVSTPLWQLPGKALRIWREKGGAALAQEIRSYARWWSGRHSV